jgi:hypothetical protein
LNTGQHEKLNRLLPADLTVPVDVRHVKQLVVDHAFSLRLGHVRRCRRAAPHEWWTLLHDGWTLLHDGLALLLHLMMHLVLVVGWRLLLLLLLLLLHIATDGIVLLRLLPPHVVGTIARHRVERHLVGSGSVYRAVNFFQFLDFKVEDFLHFLPPNLPSTLCG